MNGVKRFPCRYLDYSMKKVEATFCTISEININEAGIVELRLNIEHKEYRTYYISTFNGKKMKKEPYDVSAPFCAYLSLDINGFLHPIAVENGNYILLNGDKTAKVIFDEKEFSSIEFSINNELNTTNLKEKINQKKKNYYCEAKKLLESTEIYDLILSFYKKFYKKYNTMDKIVSLENHLVTGYISSLWYGFKNNVPNLMLIADYASENDRVQMRNIVRSTSSSKFEVKLSGGEREVQFDKNQYYPFCILIQTKAAKLNLPISSCSIYLALRDITVTTIGQDWEKQFPEFKRLKTKQARYYIEKYIQIDDYDPDSPELFYRFVNYLKYRKAFDEKKTFYENYKSVQYEYHWKKDTQSIKKKVKNIEKILNDAEENSKKIVTIDDIDMMTGEEFEKFLGEYFASKGYTTEVTKLSGDQGIDVIIKKRGKRIGIQAKCYSGSVGNSAVQEAVGGKAFYSLDKVMVITNSHFTPSAVNLAKSNDVILWDRDMLMIKINE